VVLRLCARRFFCDWNDCTAKTFPEQVDGLTSRHARVSPVLRRMLESIGLALAGRAGARLATRLGLPVSRNTVLRLVRRLPDPKVPAVGERPALFLDYDGVLTPIVARPEDAVISPGMRATVQALSRRCPVCVISGRDRTVVQRLMGIDDLIVAGSHGFDIWSPRLGTLDHPEAAGSGKLISQASEHVRDRLEGVDGVLIEPKKVSVAVHYRLVAPAQQEKVTAAVRAVVGEFAPSLKVTPGKDVYEIQPNLDWNKGRALQFLLTALGLDGSDVLPFYLGLPR
jgi:trehalose 6-phosphate phosphatase